MKRAMLALAVLLLVVLPAQVFALGSWTTSTLAAVPNSNIRTMTVTFTADAAAATVPDYTFTAADIAFVKGYHFYGAETNPGAVAPSDNYDIVVTSAQGADLFGTALTNRDQTNTEWASPKPNGSDISYPPLDGTALTISVSGNVVNSATSAIKFYLVR